MDFFTNRTLSLPYRIIPVRQKIFGLSKIRFVKKGDPRTVLGELHRFDAYKFIDYTYDFGCVWSSQNVVMVALKKTSYRIMPILRPA
jgi:hypothetical protein